MKANTNPHNKCNKQEINQNQRHTTNTLTYIGHPVTSTVHRSLISLMFIRVYCIQPAYSHTLTDIIKAIYTTICSVHIFALNNRINCFFLKFY